MKEAARRIQLDAILHSGDDMRMQRQVLATVPRAIWFNDRMIAKNICESSTIANDLPIIVGRRVLCRNLALFDQLFNDARHNVHTNRIGQLTTNIAAATSSNLKKQLKLKLQAATRLQKVFWPR